MDDPSIKKRLLDLYTDEHEYDEVQEIPEESSIQPPETSTSHTSTNGSSHSGPGTATGPGATSAGPSAGAPQSPVIVVDSVPELPAPKQKSVKNSKSKQKQKQLANKSKIPRSPSLASSLSSLASSLSGHRDRDKDRDKDRENQNAVPPQTPPLPPSYKQNQMNGDSTAAAGGGVSAPATPTTANNNNASHNNGSIMGGGVQLNQSDNSNPVLQAPGERSSLNLTPLSRDLSGGHTQESTTPATTPSTPSLALPKNFQYLTLTVRKDSNGYGMKVSGDNPVFVESVKPGGAAEIAGLVAGDMILRVNGHEVRLEKHPTVVGLIKASTTVELAVKRSQKLTRPSSVSVVTPSTPILSGRDRTASITGPQPVDSIKRREMETYKIQTLQKMLEQEKLNLERLKSDQNNPSYKLSEANIRKLREQLHQVGAEQQRMSHQAESMSQSMHQHTSTPTSQQFFHPHQQQHRFKETGPTSKGKNKFLISRSLIEEDVPPPLPQRNPPRQLNLDLKNGNASPGGSHLVAPVSDLDRATSPQLNRSQQQQLPSSTDNSPSNAKSKRSKIKTKALSDPKMSTQMFLQMESASAAGAAGGSIEVDGGPPPLPPRLPGMMTEDMSRGSCQNLAQPNSVGTAFNYPLVSTTTAVQNDNLNIAFPLSQRPNIVQQLQQYQQQQQHQMSGGQATGALGQTPNLGKNKHRRVGSSPDNMHPRHPDRITKTTSGSWEIVEKDGESSPPGTPPPPYLSSSHMTVLEDPNENNRGAAAAGPGVFIESHQFTPMAGASSPIPISLHSSHMHAAQSNDTQKEIISMEDENSDLDEPFIDENGPFNNLTRLLEAENVTFLAIFLNYVISNSDPAPLLFYLITELYKEGTSKDMRKWAYEIHSTFLVPRAPLSWYRQDESLAREVDNVLQLEYDKVEILRTVFLRSRKRAKDLISEQLREFQQKRTAGLGTIYGPTDDKLAEAKTDKLREQIIDKYLMPNLHALIEDENGSPPEDVRKVALCSALSTVIYRIFNTRPPPSSIVERVHHFVSRDKSFKSRIMGKNRKMNVRGHPLVLRQYYEVTHCNHCQTIIWGVSPQGYHCTDCKLNIHRQCSKVVDESCPGPLPQAKRLAHNDKISKFMGKIRPRTSDVIGNEKRSRQDEELDVELTPDRGQASIVRQPSDRRPDANISIRSNGNTSCNTSGLNTTDLQSSFHGSCANDSINPGGGAGCNMDLSTSVASTTPSTSGSVAAGLSAFAELNALDTVDKEARRERYSQHPKHKSAPVSVNRSESYKERLSNKRNRNSRRKTSDPSLSSRPNDEQLDLGLSNATYVGSSNSSLSSAGGSESPSTSMEHFAAPGAAGGVQVPPMGLNQNQHPHLLIQQHAQQYCQQDSFQAGLAGAAGSSAASNSSFWNAGHPLPVARWTLESEDEDDVNEADWSSMVAAEVLAALTDAEKKRQEIINEIYQTERNHVRTLKLLDRLFFLPLYESGLLSQDHLLLLFPPALLSLREIHGAFEQSLKQRRIEHNHVVNTIGDLLADMFDGQSGVVLCEFAAQFCARQQIALEALKEKRNKDEMLQKLLKKSESHKACRRLELKDLLPTVLQRLTKYPLLFENLYKVTVRLLPENTTEAEAIQRAVESSKRILVEVNQAVKTAEDAHKLQNIQRKLDRSSYDKEEFKKLDLTQHHLIHDGNLTIKKNPSVQLHGLLFENMIVLLTKQDDKYYLKNLHTPLSITNKPVSPIMSIDADTLIRQEAADKNSFFLIKMKTSQMLELRAPSSSECKTWFKHFSDVAARQSKNRSKNASSNHDTSISDPALAAIPHSNTKESLELSTDTVQPLAATATLTTTPLAPMLPIATVTPAPATNNSNVSSLTGVQLRNPQRDATASESDADYVNTPKPRSSQNEVNRTMSIRSTGEPIQKYSANGTEANDVTLRHSQSTRESVRPGSTGEERNSTYGMVGGNSKRDSASIVCSNNSNNTRTLLMQSPLVDPTAIQVSISPAHTAEPVLTPGEKLRRLDASIRNDLLEKQKIICDIFRLPVEHYDQIVDIAMMPEAPKDSADIALAAYDQIQTLTKMLNEYMHVTPEQEVSAVSTAVCGHCHEKEKLRKKVAPSSSFSSSPPPLPPPNRQHAQAQAQIPPSRLMPKLQTLDLDEVAIHEDDDGYCEIDELRLPAIPSKPHERPTTPLAPFNTEPKTSQSVIDASKRQSTDAVPEGLLEQEPLEGDKTETKGEDNEVKTVPSDKLSESCNEERQCVEADITKEVADPTTSKNEAAASVDELPSQSREIKTAENASKSVADKKEDNEETIEEGVASTVDSSTQTSPTESPKETDKLTGGSSSTCGPNRIQHASVLEPSVPCHALSSIVTILNEQISMLLPKINERDMERERLRKENQHLRELLSALHDRQRVDEVKETPFDLKKLMHAEDVEFDDDIDAISNSSLTPTPTPIPTASPSASGQVETAEAMRITSTEDEE
uniref:Rho guanine nucleotide exchange factor 2, isoform H n=1 Tax=Drosophila melanogaster TaxID=7227 RepID=A0A0B4LFF8_DROME|nr:Rho guanine nucleotide exchange factor 2, isoform H [Drosophila melanogaster]AHN56311.1 Rho guanine nucleotide exchange factor 2, isoform H [Drosophila melanogaster]|eukprot:NP_001286515.1 Rho guanine nucleotide exchange factor 2, isoform H [Drosophila melanogaster]